MSIVLTRSQITFGNALEEEVILQNEYVPKYNLGTSGRVNEDD